MHSSTVTVAVLGGQSKDTPRPWLQRRDEDFDLVWFSGTGCGGQHRNRHMNSARLTHLPTGIVKTAQTRSRENSHQAAKQALLAELDRLASSQASAAVNTVRQTQVGSGERSDRRRIWAFQRDVVDDLVTGRSIRCSDALKGQLHRLW